MSEFHSSEESELRSSKEKADPEQQRLPYVILFAVVLTFVLCRLITV